MKRPAAILAALLLSGAAAGSEVPPSEAEAPPPEAPPPEAPPPEAPPPEAPPPEGPASRAPAVAGRDGRPSRAPSWFAFPVLFWLPETKLGVGAAGGLHFHVLGAERASSIFLLSAYTLGRQVIVDVPGDLYFPRGGSVSGRVRGVVFPDAYYGIGPSTQTSAREDFTRRAIEAWVGGEYPIVPNRLSAGPRLEVRSEEITDMQAGGALASGAVPGSRGFGVIGIGGTITYDSRDQPLSPERGSFAQMWILQYPAFVGGGHAAFTHGLLEGRKFLPLGRGRVLGVAAFVEQASADTPFTLLPKLGSTRYLRGWREGRFRDRLAWAAQAEIRLPLAGRLGAAVFGAVGDVARNLGALRADTLKVAAGAGLRFRLTREGASIRLDLAGSQAGPEVYAIMLEAF